MRISKISKTGKSSKSIEKQKKAQKGGKGKDGDKSSKSDTRKGKKGEKGSPREKVQRGKGKEHSVHEKVERREEKERRVPELREDEAPRREEPVPIPVPDLPGDVSKVEEETAGVQGVCEGEGERSGTGSTASSAGSVSEDQGGESIRGDFHAFKNGFTERGKRHIHSDLFAGRFISLYEGPATGRPVTASVIPSEVSPEMMVRVLYSYISPVKRVLRTVEVLQRMILTIAPPKIERRDRFKSYRDYSGAINLIPVRM